MRCSIDPSKGILREPFDIAICRVTFTPENRSGRGPAFFDYGRGTE